MSRAVTANTLLWLRDKPYNAGTEFAVVDKPDPSAGGRPQVDIGTADLWVRQGKAAEGHAPKKPA